jgi:hypothetical protein
MSRMTTATAPARRAQPLDTAGAVRSLDGGWGRDADAHGGQSRDPHRGARDGEGGADSDATERRTRRQTGHQCRRDPGERLGLGARGDRPADQRVLTGEHRRGRDPGEQARGHPFRNRTRDGQRRDAEHRAGQPIGVVAHARSVVPPAPAAPASLTTSTTAATERYAVFLYDTQPP